MKNFSLLLASHPTNTSVEIYPKSSSPLLVTPSHNLINMTEEIYLKSFPTNTRVSIHLKSSISLLVAHSTNMRAKIYLKSFYFTPCWHILQIWGQKFTWRVSIPLLVGTSYNFEAEIYLKSFYSTPCWPILQIWGQKFTWRLSSSLVVGLSHKHKIINLPEEFPVYSLLGRAGPAHKHNWAYFAVCRADGHANFGG